jgi:hypothetical protein
MPMNDTESLDRVDCKRKAEKENDNAPKTLPIGLRSLPVEY